MKNKRKSTHRNHEYPRIAVAAVLITLSAAFIAAGIASGDLEIIYRKAVFICMECIGIG
jgi:hypothetical protein